MPVLEASGCTHAAACLSQAPRVAKRSLSGMAEPDPQFNPAPSDKVLEIADAVESLTVKEAVWLNRVLKERLGITDADLGIGMAAAAPVAAPAGGAGAAGGEEDEPVEEKKDFTVVIEGYESAAKIKIIKELRSVVPDLGLKEAKALVCTRLTCSHVLVVTRAHHHQPIPWRQWLNARERAVPISCGQHVAALCCVGGTACFA